MASLPSGVLHVLDGRPRDLGGFSVRRVLPAVECKMVGPFIFFDHFGPVTFPPGAGVDVRPHPHINLATVTYLFEGDLVHRDSLGTLQTIRAGDVNWMTAGRGIVHSERTDPAVRAAGFSSHGIQLWLALPTAHEETEPSFHHHPSATLPTLGRPGVALRLMAGTAFGATSPVATFSPLFYVDARLQAGSTLELPDDHEQRAAYVVEGAVTCGDARFEVGRMVVFVPGAMPVLRADAPARVLLLGGAPLDGDRHVYWNFVSSRKERIEQAKADWKAGRFPKIPGDSDEFIPLPE